MATVQAKTDDEHRETPEKLSYGEQLVQLIPAEAIAVFTAGLALCVGFGWGWAARWAWFGAIAVLIPFWVFLKYWDTLSYQKRRAKRVPIPYVSILAGFAAFVIWSATIPDTPFLQWHEWKLEFAPFVTLAGVVVLTMLVRWHRDVWKVRHPAHKHRPRHPHPA
ncbi:MAG TPA: hypothetical protein VH816_09435 [Gaiellaceae bacterium]